MRRATSRQRGGDDVAAVYSRGADQLLLAIGSCSRPTQPVSVLPFGLASVTVLPNQRPGYLKDSRGTVAKTGGEGRGRGRDLEHLATTQCTARATTTPRRWAGGELRRYGRGSLPLRSRQAARPPAGLTRRRRSSRARPPDARPRPPGRANDRLNVDPLTQVDRVTPLKDLGCYGARARGGAQGAERERCRTARTVDAERCEDAVGSGTPVL